MNILRELSRLASERGRTHEHRVEESFKSLVGTPNWFRSISKSTQEQDRRGIDFIVETADMGSLYVQVKSSKTGKNEFKKRQGARANKIAIVIIRDTDDHARIRAKVISSLMELRKRLRP